MGNTAKRDAARLTKAERARRGAELRKLGHTWDEIATALGYAHRSNAKRAVDDYRQELPREAVDELQQFELEASLLAYKGARNAADKLTGTERVDAEVKVARILKVHGELGGVIKLAPEVKLEQTQTVNAFDASKHTPEELAQMHAFIAKQRGEVSPLADAPPRVVQGDEVVEAKGGVIPGDTKPSEEP